MKINIMIGLCIMIVFLSQNTSHTRMSETNTRRNKPTPVSVYVHVGAWVGNATPWSQKEYHTPVTTIGDSTAKAT